MTERGFRAVALESRAEAEAAARALDGVGKSSLGDPSFSLVVEYERPFARLFVAYATNDAPSGFLVAWKVADELHVLHVAVDPAARRRGLGRALVAEALAFAASYGARIALLEVRKSNAAAIALYATMGFRETGLRKSYYSDGTDALEMALELRSTPAV